jgi:hypothetical protein
MLCACARRKSRQESPVRSPAGSKPASLRSFRTVVAETRKAEPTQLADDPLITPTRIPTG